MAIVNAIQNGGFESSASNGLSSPNWTGTDNEFSYQNSYFGDGSFNWASELDGTGSSTTASVLEQTITITGAQSTTLEFDMGLRNTATSAGANPDGFLAEVLDSNGAVVAQQNYYPTTNSFSHQSLAVDFPGAGDYTVRFTELNPGTTPGAGAIIDNVSLLHDDSIVCFTAGTLIDTQDGEKLMQDLKVGDMIRTFDRGFQPLRFIYCREVLATPTTRPVIFEAGVIGNTRRLRVSQQHRILTTQVNEFIKSSMVENALVCAAALVNGSSIRIDMVCDKIEYFHLMFDHHELVHTQGVVSESWQPHKRNLKRDKMLREELMGIFPEIAVKDHSNGGAPVRTPTYHPNV